MNPPLTTTPLHQFWPVLLDLYARSFPIHQTVLKLILDLFYLYFILYFKIIFEV